MGPSSRNEGREGRREQILRSSHTRVRLLGILRITADDDRPDPTLALCHTVPTRLTPNPLLCIKLNTNLRGSFSFCCFVDLLFLVSHTNTHTHSQHGTKLSSFKSTGHGDWRNGIPIRRKGKTSTRLRLYAMAHTQATNREDVKPRTHSPVLHTHTRTPGTTSLGTNGAYGFRIACWFGAEPP